MLTAMEGGLSEVDRAFTQKFIPDSYELLNVYKLYDETLIVDDHIDEVKAASEAAAQ